MARSDYWQYMVDNNGRPLSEVEVRVYLAGSLIEANIFVHPEFGSYKTSSDVDLKTSRFGFVQFWIGDQWETSGGYEEDQLFKIVWQNTVDGIEESIDNLMVFAAVRPIVIDDSIRGQLDNRNLDKVISNRIGYRWDAHVDSIVPSASPHDLLPVEWFDTNGKQNKVISNKLGYQMYQMGTTAATTAVDTSAATYYSTNVTSWSTSGGIYYKDITHNFGNYYPIVEITKESDLTIVKAKRIESVSPNVTRVWMENNINVYIAFSG